MARHPHALTAAQAEEIASADEGIVTIVLTPRTLPHFRRMFDRVGVGLVPVPFATEGLEFILSPDNLTADRESS